MNGTCALCLEPLAVDGLEGIVDHVRLMHPDQFEDPQRWPDGGLVVVDETDPTADEIGGARREPE